ncbi:MAG: hypothetical protein U0T74_13905 [Chitinophagales bacterium]
MSYCQHDNRQRDGTFITVKATVNSKRATVNESAVISKSYRQHDTWNCQHLKQTKYVYYSIRG